MPRFTDLEASPETYFRSIILFGKNVASYKFALGQALLNLAAQGRSFVTLEDLAPEYVRSLLVHLQSGEKQGTFRRSRFLEACQQHLEGHLSAEALMATTVKLGFNNVIDAFHIVGGEEVPVPFFVDERRNRRGITLTDALLALPETARLQYRNLPHEVEARWRLVEMAWTLRLPPGVISVFPDEALGELVVLDQEQRRRSLGRVHDALNGYQKGRCFYCGVPISISPENLTADVDHVFPHVLMRRGILNLNLDGIWNLVLACQECNRGADGKFASVPARPFVEKLYRRNELFISSHHPLRETLLRQLGAVEAERRIFLEAVDRSSVEALVFRWKPPQEHQHLF